MRHLLELTSAFLNKYKDPIEAVAALIGAAAAIAKLGPPLLQYVQSRWDEHCLRGNLGAEAYTHEEIIRATRHYIVPDCQDVDPGGSEDFRTVYSIRQNAFDALDRLMTSDPEHRHTIILADSGMGKTSLLMNYYARHQRSRRRRKRFKIVLLPLGLPGIEEKIAAVTNRAQTVLLLDAFDEDTKAISNHRDRLGFLLKMTMDFRHLVVSCRTQFFLKEEEIPRETGLIRVGVTAAGESHEYLFYKIYLSPFSDDQVEYYLRRRFGVFRRGQRRAAKYLAAKMKDLTVRPMLLAHVPDLLGLQRPIQNSFDLYEEMVKAWISREKPFVENGNALRSFSERLAVDIYAERKNRGSERIPQEQLEPLAEKYGIHLPEWQLSGRSLLNRDAAGNLKFAHRSIMEYLFIRRFITAPETVAKTEWTEQMKRFWWEIATSYYSGDGKFPDSGARYGILGWELADLSDVDRLGFHPIYRGRTLPRILSPDEAVAEWRGSAESPVARPPHALGIVKHGWEGSDVYLDAPKVAGHARVVGRGGSSGETRFMKAPPLMLEKDAYAIVERTLYAAVERTLGDSASGLNWLTVTFPCGVGIDEAKERAREISEVLYGGRSFLRLPTTIEVLGIAGERIIPWSDDPTRRMLRFPGVAVCCSDSDRDGLPYSVRWRKGGPPLPSGEARSAYLFVTSHSPVFLQGRPN